MKNHCQNYGLDGLKDYTDRNRKTIHYAKKSVQSLNPRLSAILTMEEVKTILEKLGV